jgi:hypothetical protein
VTATVPTSQTVWQVLRQSWKERSLPVMVIVAVLGAAALPVFCSLPLMVTAPVAVVAAAPGFGSTTITNRPRPSTQPRRCFPASSVVSTIALPF